MQGTLANGLFPAGCYERSNSGRCSYGFSTFNNIGECREIHSQRAQARERRGHVVEHGQICHRWRISSEEERAIGCLALEGALYPCELNSSRSWQLL